MERLKKSAARLIEPFKSLCSKSVPSSFNGLNLELGYGLRLSD